MTRPVSVLRVEDLTSPPVIGETYLVPCIWGSALTHPRPSSFEWIPITGPRHSDSDYIGFNPMHFHFDHQFLSERFRKELVHWMNPEPLTYVAEHYDKAVGIVHWPLVCVRHVKSYPRLSFSSALEHGYRNKAVTCGKCPHRGLPLSSLPREPGTDIVTCPGHGLRWDLNTGDMVGSVTPNTVARPPLRGCAGER